MGSEFELWRGHASEPLIERLIEGVNMCHYLPPKQPEGWLNGRAIKLFNAAQIQRPKGVALTTPFLKRAPRVQQTGPAAVNTCKSRFFALVQLLYLYPDAMSAYINMTPRERMVTFRIAAEGSDTRLMLAAAKIYVAATRVLGKKESDDEHS